MAGKNTAAFGIYRTRTALEQGVEAFESANFRNEDISVCLRTKKGPRSLLTRTTPRHPKAPQGGGSRWSPRRRVGLAGGIVALAIPGVGPFIAAGPIVAALARCRDARRVGRIIGALIGSEYLSTRPNATKANQGRRNSDFGSLRQFRVDKEKPKKITAAHRCA